MRRFILAVLIMVCLMPAITMAQTQPTVTKNIPVTMTLTPPAPVFNIDKLALVLPTYMATSTWTTFAGMPNQDDGHKFTLQCGYMGSGVYIIEVQAIGVAGNDAAWDSWAQGNIAYQYDGANTNPVFKAVDTSGIGVGDFRLVEATSPFGPIQQGYVLRVRNIQSLPVGVLHGNLLFKQWVN
jgi:hypothetical protein